MSNVDDVKVKGVPFEIRGTTYHLTYDFNAFAELEKMYGTLRDALKALGGEKEVDEKGNVIMQIDPETGKVKIDPETGEEEPVRKVSIRALRSIFWAGLLDESPNITEREAGALLDLNTMQIIGPQLTVALKASMPEAKDKVSKEIASEKAEEAIKVISAKNMGGQSIVNQ